MVSRTRLITVPGASGSYKYGTNVGTFSTPDDYHKCEDIVGNYGGMNGLFINHQTPTHLIANGDNGQIGAAKREYVNCPLNVPQGTNPLPTVDTSALVTKALSRTNPNRPDIQLPVFFWELRELPDLIRIAGRTLLGTAGKGYLTWQFGWRPLIQDLQTLFQTHDLIERRVKNLEKLSRGSGLRRRYNGPTDTAKTQYPNYSIGTGAVADIRANVQFNSLRKVWVTVRWVPSGMTALPQTDSERRDFARRQVWGLTPGQIPSHVWEALPWSWLADWFTNIGDYLVAIDNSVATVSGGICIMQHTTHTTTCTINTKPGWVTVNPRRPIGLIEWKSRGISSGTPALTASLPILDGGQLAILAALFASRGDAYRSYRR